MTQTFTEPTDRLHTLRHAVHEISNPLLQDYSQQVSTKIDDARVTLSNSLSLGLEGVEDKIAATEEAARARDAAHFEDLSRLALAIQAGATEAELRDYARFEELQQQLRAILATLDKQAVSQRETADSQDQIDDQRHRNLQQALRESESQLSVLGERSLDRAKALIILLAVNIVLMVAVLGLAVYQVVAR